MRSLSAILQDLDSWGRQRCPDERVAPLAEGSEEEQRRLRDALGRGIARARAGVRYISPDRIQPEQIDSDTAESLALGLLVQGREYLSQPAGTLSRDRDVKRARVAYKLMKRLEPLLLAHPAGADRRPTVQAMKDLRVDLREALSSGTRPRAARGDPEPTDDLSRDPDAVGEEVTGEFGMLGGETEDTLDRVLVGQLGSLDTDPPSEDSLDEILTGELPAELPREVTLQDPPEPVEEDRDDLIARAVNSSGPVTSSTPVLREAKASRFQIGAALLLVVLAVAALTSLVPRLMSAAAPSVDSYGEFLPVAGMIRATDPEPTLVLVVDESWDRLAPPAQRAGLQSAYELALDREGVSVVVVRDAQGHEAARATAAGVRLSP